MICHKKLLCSSIHYLETMWKIVKNSPPANKINRVIKGIEAIIRTYKPIMPCPETYINAYKLYGEEHKEYVDNLLHAVSQKLGIPAANSG
ncbi:hypothetical protein J7L29_04275 [Candidatus Bathyarchaeota archaeon]|nr:hypothetical protein [Candidatus Bathyarchaeota archaeon]